MYELLVTVENYLFFSLWTFALCIYHKYRRRTDMEIFTRRLTSFFVIGNVHHIEMSESTLPLLA